MKNRKVFKVKVTGKDFAHEQFILPNEMHLIKHWLKNEGDEVVVTKEMITQDKWDQLF